MNHRTGNKIASVQFPLFFQIAVVENNTFNSIKLNNIFKLGVYSPATKTKVRCLCLDSEQSLFSQSSLSSAGLERAKWPRGKLERVSARLLVFFFRSLRWISSLAWPSWGTASSLAYAWVLSAGMIVVITNHSTNNCERNFPNFMAANGI